MNISEVSNIGTRSKNQDYIKTCTIRSHGRKIDIFVLCDGVGSYENSEECSKAIAEKSIEIASQILLAKKTKKQIDKNDFIKIKYALMNLTITQNENISASTFTMSIIDRKRTKKGGILFCYWSGDTRVYFKYSRLNSLLTFTQLTTDDIDNEGRVIKFFKSDGSNIGGLNGKLVFFKTFNYLIHTTDGVHDNCTFNELHNYCEYWFKNKISSNSIIGEDLNYFLANNISDNYSIIFYS